MSKCGRKRKRKKTKKKKKSSIESASGSKSKSMSKDKRKRGRSSIIKITIPVWNAIFGLSDVRVRDRGFEGRGRKIG